MAKLKASGKKGTPVTAETLKAWQERKRKRKEEEERKILEKEMKKKKGGKGLSVLSGRALYAYNQSLFADEEGESETLDVNAVPRSGLNDDASGNATAAVATAGSEQKESIFEFGQKGEAVDDTAKKIDETLFLEGEDDDLDDLED